MQRIEAGEVSVSGTDLQAMLALFGITDGERIRRLLDAGRISSRQRWTMDPEWREHLTPAYAQLLQFESAAVAIRTYQLVLIPGPMQTAEYADALLDFHDTTLSPDQRRVRFDVRMRRRRLLEPDSGTQYLAILDESVLKREIGGLAVMARQMAGLAELAARPNINIRIVPLNAGAYLGMIGPFTVLELDEDNPSDAMLYREYFLRDELGDDQDEVGRYRDRFEYIWSRALDEEKSAGAILAEATSLRSRSERS